MSRSKSPGAAAFHGERRGRAGARGLRIYRLVFFQDRHPESRAQAEKARGALVVSGQGIPGSKHGLPLRFAEVRLLADLPGWALLGAHLRYKRQALKVRLAIGQAALSAH